MTKNAAENLLHSHANQGLLFKATADIITL